MKDKILRLGFLQASTVAFYCSLVGLLFWKGNQIFGNTPNYLGPVVFLLLFCTSVMTCGVLVFYRPYKMFFDGKKKEAADLVVYTAIGLVSYLILGLLVLLLI